MYLTEPCLWAKPMFSFKCAIAFYSSEPSEASVISRKCRSDPASMNYFSNKKRWVGGPGRSEQLPLVPGSSLVNYARCLPYSIRGSIHAKAEGMTGGKKAEMAVHCTKANAKQCKSSVLKAVFKLKVRGVEGKLGATLIFPSFSTGDLILNC